MYAQRQPLREPEKAALTLGYIPLTDCAPLVVALEQGFFAQYGLDVVLSREPSWANIRDKVGIGLLDGAQMLAPMPLASSLGADALAQPMVVGLSLGLNGNAITVSQALYRRLVEQDPHAMANEPITARALRKLLAADRAEGREPPTFAMVYPYSSHNYLLRYWLAAGGVDPDRDVRLIVVPPPRMVEQLEAGRIDGYCVGEPWNSAAVASGVGRVLLASCDIWNNHPEKVFSVTQSWAEQHPATHQALIMALIEACRWLDDPINRLKAASLLAQPDYLDTPESVVLAGLTGRFRQAAGEGERYLPDFHVFHRYAANFPWLSHAEWIVTQMLRWHQIEAPADWPRRVRAVYRPDLYRAAADALGLPCPAFERKSEGAHDEPWQPDDASPTLGPDRFIDDRIYDERDPLLYLHSFSPDPGAANGDVRS
ncbi:CmpA/NrtA family ABC transporter substrate-binding protein [Methylococcus sp. EFPC2]|uniref:CmpA/NrtA family ABC transporter substrate-binding protein n=1 Tax=Methylococcus sp. EFPC2 TaxID=2812648 RepID=UPI0019685CB4|nr:CmpA/NrtA family ABC transporter substrate-binding protein [Methylococcus sp. EFPC2]QSA97655.1 ABC transporter substrate-binding protein [Methylococcus sp. EFPC2]